MQTFMLCTRKGLFEFHGQGAHWSIAKHHFAGEAVSQFHVDQKSGAWFAAQNLGHFGLKLKKSTDRGVTWEEMPCPAFPPKPETGLWANDETPWNVGMIWSMASDSAGTLWAGCMPAGLFRSRDGGQTWQLMESLWFTEKRKAWMGGGNDHPGIHSISIDPRDTNAVAVAISCGGLWRTRDGGIHWENFGEGMNAVYMPPELAGDPNIQDPHRVAVCRAAPNVWWMQHHFGLYRSEDAGEHWCELPAPLPTSFGFTVVADPHNPLRAWVVPAQADVQRYAPDGAMCVNRTDDGGATWQTFRTGLPQSHAYQLVYRHNLALAPDGKTLVMGSTTGGVWVSVDAGESWSTLPVSLPLVSAVVWV
jgi:photosystem II stability/assembly factor-like uncharacterized protein